MKTIDKLSARALQKYSDELRHIAVLAYACDALQDVVHIHRMSSSEGGVHITAHAHDRALIEKNLVALGFGPGTDIEDFTTYELSGSVLYIAWADIAREAA
jgi:hypothetical protein